MASQAADWARVGAVKESLNQRRTGGLKPAKETEAEKRGPRYRETDHVRAFYQSNRY